MPVLKVANIHFNAAGTRGIEWQNDSDNIVRIQAGAIRVPLTSDSITIPTPTAGLIRYNTTVGSLEVYNASSWGKLAEVSAFPSGTKTVFPQTTAPLSWTKQTSANNDHTLRVVTGTAANGGTVDFTTAFASKTVAGSITVGGSTGGFTLTTAEIPGHSHSVLTFAATIGATGRPTSATLSAPSVQQQASDPTGGGAAHSHPATGLTATFGSGTVIDLAVRYVDVIIAVKD